LNDRLFLNIRGFTLLELIIVLILIALIAGLTTPYLMATLDRVKGEASVKRIATLFRAARSKAVSEKVPYSFNANMENNQYWLINMETEETSSIHKLDKTIKIFEFSDKEETITDGIFNIFFYPQGNTSGGTLFLTSRGTMKVNYSLTLDPITGKPYVEQQIK
tara:strand:- start:359 stop:847 length:489 start_codon:yes stop_codon:yes gene_type:complete